MNISEIDSDTDDDRNISEIDSDTDEDDHDNGRRSNPSSPSAEAASASKAPPPPPPPTPADDGENPMDAAKLDDGTPLSVLLSRAAALKSAMSAPLRSTYDSFPPFYRNTVYPRREVEEARGGGGLGRAGGADDATSTFEDRMGRAEEFKREGNDAFRGGDYGGAMVKYEMGCAVFRWLENTNPKWKTEGIKDDDIIERSFDGESAEQGRAVRSFLVSSYCNMALTCLRSGGDNFRVAVQACGEALALTDGKCGRALYLRARARVGPKSAGGAEQDMALGDLREASRLDPDDRAVRKELQSLRQSIKSQRKRDRATFRGLFGSGGICGDVTSPEGGAESRDDTRRQRQGTEGAFEYQNRTYTIDETLRLADLCAGRGLAEEERSLRELVQRRQDAARRGLPDFRNPTPEMVQEAEKMGVDLGDVRVVDMLERMQRRKAAGTGDGSGDSLGGGLCDDARAPERSVTRRIKRIFLSAFKKWIQFLRVHLTNKGLRPYITAAVVLVAIRLGGLLLISL